MLAIYKQKFQVGLNKEYTTNTLSIPLDKNYTAIEIRERVDYLIDLNKYCTGMQGKEHFFIGEYFIEFVND